MGCTSFQFKLRDDSQENGDILQALKPGCSSGGSTFWELIVAVGGVNE
jgi:hypothetical protein